MHVPVSVCIHTCPVSGVGDWIPAFSDCPWNAITFSETESSDSRRSLGGSTLKHCISLNHIPFCKVWEVFKIPKKKKNLVFPVWNDLSYSIQIDCFFFHSSKEPKDLGLGGNTWVAVFTHLYGQLRKENSCILDQHLFFKVFVPDSQFWDRKWNNIPTWQSSEEGALFPRVHLD